MNAVFRLARSLCGILAALLFIASNLYGAPADNIVMKVRAVNPADQPQKVVVRSFLPPDIHPDDVVDSGELDITYDVVSGLYIAETTVELPARQARTFNVRMRDVWYISESTIADLAAHASGIQERLSETAHGAAASGLQLHLTTALDRIRRDQAAATITKTTPKRHIDAYDANIELLRKAKFMVLQLEDLAIAAGIDPGDLQGELPVEVKSTPASVSTAAGVVTMTIRLSNPSSVAQVLPFRRDLPAEIEVEDVVFTDGLSVRTDFKKNVTYLYDDVLRLEPKADRVFKIKLRDRWTAADQRITRLSETIEEEKDRRDAIKSVRAKLDELADKLNAMRAEELPQNFDADYVAFYRQRAERIDAIEQELTRIWSARPRSDSRKPMKLTWIAIFAILILLAAVTAWVLLSTIKSDKKPN